uniref:C4-type zinc finger protein, DksA/TraR family n=1 Tax=Pseudomonas fluorescens (strain SBW25) TaxID=216595 RepID=A0A0G4E569_PSEFS|nr:TraR/DksA family transcriptional regulator [Pseudomonas fluorescens]CEK42148.1 C4-type zinc finger protein, DksA/TraR family [Pseudomonas fluorescens SBW25]
MMTEEQLLAQSADDYMNAGQLAFFKKMLLEKASSVRDRIKSNQALCVIERHSDASDTASTEEDRAKALRLIDMDNQMLRQISLALTSIADESYGWCEDTGEPITLQRLLLIPESLLSVDAMQARESRGRHQRAA